jgi:alpha-tubulin suppressor-like RCC1 family protein
LGNVKEAFIKSPTKIEALAGVKIEQISCSKGAKHNHTGCVDSEGNLYMWGDPYKGQLGHYSDSEGWDHKEKALYGTPLLIKTAEPIK